MLFYMDASKWLFLKTLHEIVLFFGRVQWKLSNPLEAAQLDVIQNMLEQNDYIILTMRRNHLSTLLINLCDFLLKGQWGFYAHALMNTQKDMENQDSRYLIEATGEGVKRSKFAEVFDCHAVAILRPKHRDINQWNLVVEKALSAIGKPYNSLFTLQTEEAVTCASLVRSALMASPNYYRDFPHFEAMVKKYGKLTPQMFYDCTDFEIVYEVRR